MSKHTQTIKNKEVYSQSFVNSFEHVSINEGKAITVSIGKNNNLIEIPRNCLSISPSGDDGWFQMTNKKTHETISIKKIEGSSDYVAMTPNGEKKVFITNQGVDSRFHPEFDVPRMSDSQIEKFYYSVYNQKYEMVSPEFAKMALDVGINKWLKKLNRDIVDSVKDLSGIDIFLGNKADTKDCFSENDLKVMHQIENQHGDHALSVALAAKGNFDNRNKRNLAAIPGAASSGLSAQENYEALLREKRMYEEMVNAYDEAHLPRVQKNEAIAIEGVTAVNDAQKSNLASTGLRQEGTDQFNEIKPEFLQGTVPHENSNEAEMTH